MFEMRDPGRLMQMKWAIGSKGDVERVETGKKDRGGGEKRGGGRRGDEREEGNG